MKGYVVRKRASLKQQEVRAVLELGTGGSYSESRWWVEIEESAGQLDGLKEELFVISKSCCSDYRMMAATLHLRVKVLDGGEEVA